MTRREQSEGEEEESERHESSPNGSLLLHPLYACFWSLCACLFLSACLLVCLLVYLCFAVCACLFVMSLCRYVLLTLHFFLVFVFVQCRSQASLAKEGLVEEAEVITLSKSDVLLSFHIEGNVHIAMYNRRCKTLTNSY